MSSAAKEADVPATLAEDQSMESSYVSEDQTTTQHTQNTGTREGQSLSREETKAVNRSKLLVYFAIVVAAAAIGALVYVLSYNDETQDFEREVSQ